MRLSSVCTALEPTSAARRSLISEQSQVSTAAEADHRYRRVLANFAEYWGVAPTHQPNGQQEALVAVLPEEKKGQAVVAKERKLACIQSSIHYVGAAVRSPVRRAPGKKGD